MNIENEIKRIKKTSDQLCSMHNSLARSYNKKGLSLNLLVTFFSGWLISLTFIDPLIGNIFNPTGLENNIFFGIISVLIFILSLFEIKVDYKGLSSQHEQAQQNWYKVLQKARAFISEQDFTNDSLSFLQELSNSVSDNSIAIPNEKFLKLKKQHKVKIRISKELDSKPGTLIWFFRIKLFFQDNF